MFRVKESEVNRGIPWAMLALAVVIVAAAIMTAWLTWMLRVERGMIGDLIGGKAETSSDLVRALPGVLRWQFGLALVVLVILVATAVALIVIRRAYLASRQSLREVKVLAGDILASMDQAVVTTNCDGVITSINPGGRELLAVEFECVGRPIGDITRPDLPLKELSCEVLARRRAVNDRDFAISRNGHTHRLRADCHLLRDTNGDVLGAVLHVRDVTERVLVEERMRRMERHLGLGSLAVGLHHEIKNPLTALSLHVQLLDERLAGHSGGREVDELLGVLKTEVTRLNGVLETFRDFAAFRSLSVQPTDVTGLIDKAVRLVRPQADLQAVRITVVPPEPQSAVVPLDGAKFEQVLLNLIINALEAMPGGGELTIRVRAADGQLRVHVADTGCGIPPEIQPRIFDPYFTTRSDGAGMGLSWTEKIVQQHQGHIEFETGPGGTVFQVTIPMLESTH
ncbi:MAG: PAS domain-containing protein [Planctomycetes bacterium]|nr:PAS domain-containing protein [Planctomycetota bacterium]